ncbi:hypothetical protein A2480_01880 [Candidatus Uhrbacteria bacterium RIFOXYC2_FULL_47_19]|uniref:Uncharacterized protein n=1 Tax=Candidatus Uhrbacteria bacterium RIFOXYC2_FULL_47_19 TaxID=1802424 RepID=A0A1F7WGS5_9BACT|nr:MAG: hypothetical protein A2480_01880 [Candidatus Uhrbacteria bacterium RIFOXYC2_FULL_47_19]HCC22220.1 hypothetical protein [Candidatus Uhrbacteria bacterium]
MRKKKHNSDEIRFCQSRLHKCLYEFKAGETCFLVAVEWDGGRPLRMVVCNECSKAGFGTLIKEIVIDNPRVTTTKTRKSTATSAAA